MTSTPVFLSSKRREYCVCYLNDNKLLKEKSFAVIMNVLSYVESHNCHLQSQLSRLLRVYNKAYHVINTTHNTTQHWTMAIVKHHITPASKCSTRTIGSTCNTDGNNTSSSGRLEGCGGRVHWAHMICCISCSLFKRWWFTGTNSNNLCN